MATEPTKIGILGCGVISGIYIETAQKVDAIELAAIADVNPEAARFRAGQYGIERVLTPEELLADPEIEIIVSLTPNRLHGQIGKQVIEAGKNLYSEKPFAVYREEALENVALADARACAPAAPPIPSLALPGRPPARPSMTASSASPMPPFPTSPAAAHP